MSNATDQQTEADSTHALDFVALQVANLDEATAFYTEILGFEASEDQGPPIATVFSSGQGASFAVREPLDGVELSDGPEGGAVLWFDVDALYDRVTGRDVETVSELQPGQFGRQFGIRDPDGYRLVFHELPN